MWNQKERSIIHVDLDTFFVSCERLANTQLNNRPLIIGGQGPRAVVSSCSYETRRFGVQSGMPMRYALRLCPEAKVLKGDYEAYDRQSKLIAEILGEQAPVLEQASIDEFYIDATGLDKYFGCLQWTKELVTKTMRETGLPLSFGLSINKTVAKMATSEGKPLGQLNVTAPAVRPFLNPLSIRKIPMLGKATFTVLSRLGIRTIQTLAEMPEEMMEHLLGKNGRKLWEKANGYDTTPVVPSREHKSLSHEQTFQRDTTDLRLLYTHLAKLTEDLGFRLRNQHRLCSLVTVKIRYANFDTHTRRQSLHYTASDSTLQAVVKTLFDQLYTRRMRIRLVGVTLSGLAAGREQTHLFRDNQKDLALAQAIDRIKTRFGKKVLRRGNTLLPDVS